MEIEVTKCDVCEHETPYRQPGKAEYADRMLCLQCEHLTNLVIKYRDKVQALTKKLAEMKGDEEPGF